MRDRSGAVINDGSNPDQYTPSGAIAVIIAPGAVLQRQGATLPQDRSCTVGINCTAEEQCTTSPTSATPKCNSANYLDVLSGTEDNADFLNGSSSNGFMNGDVVVSSKVIVNDRILTITYQELMPLMERRVSKEVLNCLNAYASVPQNKGRYPWAAPISGYPSYADQTGVRFGRIPDSFGSTLLGIGGIVAAAVCPLPLVGPLLCMTTSWPSSCTLNTGTWWSHWKELVFYGVAEAYQPGDPQGIPLLPTSILPGGASGTFLTVNPPSSSANKRVVVIVSGKSLSGTAYPSGGNQPRSTTANKQSGTNYLEGENDGGTADTYTKQSTASSFNDVLQYQQ